MSSRAGLSFGGLLVGIGLGWIVFTSLDISARSMAWLLIILGSAVIGATILSSVLRVRTGGVISAFAVGLVISLLMTSGFVGPIGPLAFSKERTREFTGAVNASSIHFETKNVNGQVNVSSWTRPNAYNVTLSIRGKGTTETQAQDALSKLKESLSTQTQSGVLRLTLAFDVPTGTWNYLEVNVTVHVPADKITRLDVETTNGAIIVRDITASTLKLKTVNGAILFNNVNAMDVEAGTTNGGISGTVEADKLSATTTNGAVTVRIPSLRSGNYTLRSTNGLVTADITTGVSTGIRLDLSNTNGAITVSVPGMSYQTNTAHQKIGQTLGYETSVIKISVNARTTNGDIRVTDIRATTGI